MTDEETMGDSVSLVWRGFLIGDFLSTNIIKMLFNFNENVVNKLFK